MSEVCLFVINGLGMGNSTRCHAVMEYLAEAGFQIHVLTSGNGLAYFQDKPCVESLTPMASFFYSGKNGGVSGWATLKSARSLAAVARTKRAQLARLLEEIQPDVAVIDSEYTLAPLRRLRIPIIGLNTSEMIVSEYLKRRRRAPGIRAISGLWNSPITFSTATAATWCSVLSRSAGARGIPSSRASG